MSGFDLLPGRAAPTFEEGWKALQDAIAKTVTATELMQTRPNTILPGRAAWDFEPTFTGRLGTRVR